MAATWWDYVQRVSGGASQSEIARKIGLTSASVSRWRNSAPHPDNVRAFARAYGRPVTEAFIAAGYLSTSDLETAEERPPSETRLFSDPFEQEIWDAPGALSDDERWALIAYLRSYREVRKQG